MEHLCRTCLTKGSHSIYEECIDAHVLHEVISAITGLEIKKEDGLPALVCHECKEKAKMAFEFKTGSLKAEATLKELMKTGNIHHLVSAIKIEKDPEFDSDLKDDDMGICENSGADSNFEDQVQCNICGYVFETETAFKSHLKDRCVKVEIKDENTFSNEFSAVQEKHKKHFPVSSQRKKRGRPRKNYLCDTAIRLNQIPGNVINLKGIAIEDFKCFLCNEIFCNSIEDVFVHQINHHKDSVVYSCTNCQKMYLEEKKLQQHVCTGYKKSTQDQTSEINSYENIKTVPIPLSDILRQNEAVLKDNNIQLCQICGGLFISKEKLLDHIDVDHPDQSTRCCVCMKVFASTKTAARHKKMCTTREQNYNCHICKLKFAFEISLNKHILSSHAGECVSVKFIDPKLKMVEKKFQCDLCNQCFVRKELLEKHTAIHLKNNVRYFECDVCHRKFNRKDNLKSHMRVHQPHSEREERPKSFLCTFCGRSFSNSSNHIVHMRRHTGEKPYKCDFCGKGFPRSSDLTCHRRSHTGEKPCPCPVCGKAFSRSNKLTRHMRVHTGQKPYKCTYCEKAFSQSNDLTLHVRRHTGDKPYVCEICGDSFIQGTALQNHKRAHGHFPTTSSDNLLHGTRYGQMMDTSVTATVIKLFDDRNVQ